MGLLLSNFGGRSRGAGDRALSIIRDRYADFGPTLACEKLWECHDVRLATASRWLLGSIGINRSHKRLAASIW